MVYTTAGGLADDMVNDVAIDGQNNLWFSHDDYHLSVLSSDHRQWKQFFISGDDKRTLAVSYPSTGPVTGLKWVGTGSGAFILDDGGDPFDDSIPDPDALLWLEAESGQDPLCVENQQINDIVVDTAGRVWFATGGNGLCVLDPGADAPDLNDDQWIRFYAEDGSPGLPENELLQLALDAAGRVWVAGTGSLTVLDYGSDPFDDTDDSWGQLNVPFSMLEGGLTTLAIDTAGRKWLGGNVGLAELDDNGSPFDNSDDSWTHYTSFNSGLIAGSVRSLAVDRQGNLWVGTGAGLSILQPDDSPVWHNYTPLDGLGSGVINAIAVDTAGNRWLATGPDNSEYDNQEVNLPGGVTAALGPGLPGASPWSVYNSNEENGPASDHLFALDIDPAGNLWAAGFEETGPQCSLPLAGGGLASPLLQQTIPSVSRLSPDGSWVYYDSIPYYFDFTQGDLATAANGDVWLAVANFNNGGLYLLSAGSTPDDLWSTVGTPSELGAPVALAIDGTEVWAAFNQIEHDDYGYRPEGIAVYDYDTLSWTTVYSGSTNVNDDHVEFRQAVIDPAGDKWFATSQGVWRFPVGQTGWLIYTTNEGLESDDVTGVAIDRQGHRWFAHGYSGNVSVLSAGGDQWHSFPIEANTIGVDGRGRLWFVREDAAQVLDYGDSPFDPVDDIWTVYADDSVLSNAIVTDVIAGERNNVWLATSDDGLVWYSDPAGSGGAVLWQQQVLVDAASGETIQELTGLTAEELGVSGKLYLEAELATPGGQPLASARHPFYIFPTQTGLTLQADRTAYRPGQGMTLTGQIRNGASLELTGQTLTVWVDEQEVYTETNITVLAEDNYPFSLITTAPLNDGPVTIRAAVDEVTVQDNLEVAVPTVAADFGSAGYGRSDPL